MTGLVIVSAPRMSWPLNEKDSMKNAVLILGGTGDARELADALMAQFGDRLRVITSLAGRTSSPKRPKGEVREGGFGGVDGLISYIKDQSVDAVIDATHPFAAQISAYAAKAANHSGVPFLIVHRPEWKPEQGDDWVHVPDMATAANALSGQSMTALITTGVQNLDAFKDVTGTKLLIRLIEQPKSKNPLEDAEIIIGKPPYTLDGEKALFQLMGIDTLVTKNAGGAATRAKIDAARALGVRVIMIDRPTPPEAEQVRCQDAIERIKTILDL